MITNLKNPLEHGIQQLMVWKNHYSQSDYPERLVQNIFFRRYTLELMFPDILKCFEKGIFGKQKVKWNDPFESYLKILEMYNLIATTKVQPILVNLLKDTGRSVGNINFSVFQNHILEAKKGNKVKLEELEFAYVDFFVKDDCILRWGALGWTGLNMVDSVQKMVGSPIEGPEIETYAQIDQVFSDFYVSEFVKKHYISYYALHSLL